MMFWVILGLNLVTAWPADTTRLWFTEDSLGARLCDFVAGAESTIDYCCYNSSRTDVTLALIGARTRGVAVRVITDNSRLDDQWVAYLRGSGIAVWSDSIGPNSAAYMHNKFLVRDARDADTANDRLWVASYNPNLDETFADHAFEFADGPLCRAYLVEFNQMWGSTGPSPRPESARFHTGKSDRLPTHDFLVDGHAARLFFAPQDHVVETLTGLAGRAQRELLFAVFSYTWTRMAETMVASRNRGVVVAGLMDRSSANDPNSVFRYLRDNHLPVLYDSNLTIHEKTMVVDSTWAVTGSANWSTNANNANDENTLVISSLALVRRLHAEAVRRYLAAGGTWPPGITESPAPHPSPRSRTLFLRPGTSLPALPLHDAAGKAVREGSGLTSGVYVAARPGGGLRVVVVR